MSKEIVEVMIDGGKAVANASIAQPLAPLKVNLPEIIKKINERTSPFSGMKVPVRVIVDTKTKDFEIEVGTPPVSELIKKEIGQAKGSGTPNKNKIANLAVEQIVKIAKMKQDSILANTPKSAVKSVIGSCNSAGVLVEGKTSIEINKDINSGLYDEIINKGITQVSKEKSDILQKQLKEIQEAIKRQIEKEEALKKAEEEKAKESVKEVAPAEEAKAEAKGKEEEKVEEKAEKKPEKEVKAEKKK